MAPNLSLDLLDLFPDIILDLLCNNSNSLLIGRITHEDSRDLDDADEAEEEVDGGEKVILGLDDQAPSGPDQARAGEGQVLCE